MGVKINFEHLDEPIELMENKCNVLVVESNQVFSKILVSLYNREDGYVKIFNERFKALSDRKVFTVFNPIEFDFNNRGLKSIVHDRLASQLNLEQEKLQTIQHHFQQIVSLSTGIIEEENEIDFIWREELDTKNLLKLLDFSISQGAITNLFEKIQLLIDIVCAYFNQDLLIMANLNGYISNEEYRLVMEQINLNNQTVLFLESSQYNLGNIKHNYLDSDFIFFSNVIK